MPGLRSQASQDSTRFLATKRQAGHIGHGVSSLLAH